MIKFLVIIISALMLMPTTNICAENDVTYIYVSSCGNDENDGSENWPLKSISKAKDKAETIQGRVEVRISGGEYRFSDTLILSEKSENIRFVGYGDDKVVFSGVEEITDFDDVTDEKILKLLPLSTKNKIKCVDMSEYGDLGQMPIMGNTTNVKIEPYADGKPMNIAKFPDDGYLKVGTVKYSSVNEYPVFTYSDDRLDLLTDVENIWAYGGFGHYWACYSLDLSEIDIENRELKFNTKFPYMSKKGQEYILYNVIEDLDSEGEYYIDRENKKMYFYPYAGMKKLQLSVLAKPIITIDSTSRIEFENIEFAYSSDKAINIKNSLEIMVKNCKFYNLGKNAVSISGGNDITIYGCDITKTGVNGISINSGDRKTLTHANVVVDSCDIYDNARRANSSTSCISLYGCGNTVKNCKLYNMPHFAIAAQGNEHTIIDNEIYNVCNKNYDCGAIYFHGDWGYCGTVIENNYFHHIYGRNGKTGTRGARCVYFDNLVSGNVVRKNIFAYVEEGVFVHGGRNNEKTDNLFFDCTKTATLEAISGIEEFSQSADMIAKLTAVPLMSGVWYARYPYLSQIYSEYKKGDETYKYAKDNVIKGNILYNSGSVFMNVKYSLPYSVMTGNVHKEAVLYK